MGLGRRIGRKLKGPMFTRTRYHSRAGQDIGPHGARNRGTPVEEVHTSETHSPNSVEGLFVDFSG